MKHIIPKRVKYAEYAIRDVIVEAEKVKKKKKKILDFSVGDPIINGFDIPDKLKVALCKSVEKYNYYGNPIGEKEVREAICIKEKKYNNVYIEPENIITGNGVSEVFFIFSSGLFERGEEILVPNPCYPIFFTYPRFFGASVKFYNCNENNEWMPDVEDIKKKISKKTKAIVIINPNNPTGAVYDRKVLLEIANIAIENKLFLVCDEIYDHNVIEGKFYSLASIVKDYPTFVFNGISKCYFATGWRFGYMYLANPNKETLEMFEHLKKIARMRGFTNTVIQYAATTLMKKEPFLQPYMGEIKKRRDFFLKRLNELIEKYPYIDYVKPKGAFYIFPNIKKLIKKNIIKNDRDFVISLIKEKGIVFVYGSGFGKACYHYFRSVFIKSIEEIDEMFNKLELFIKNKSLNKSVK